MMDIRVCGVLPGSEPPGGGGNCAVSGRQDAMTEKIYRRLIRLEERVYRLEHPEEFKERGILNEGSTKNNQASSTD